MTRVDDPADLPSDPIERPIDPLTPVAQLRERPRGERIAGPEVAHKLRLEGTALCSALLLGIAESTLELAVEYAAKREQFGRPIGSFQAIAHPLADCATRVDGAELLAWEAAWADAEDASRFEELCSMAFVFAAQTAQRTTAVSLHTHGGYGVSLEYDIQLFYRRARVFSQVLGSAREELQAVAQHCFGSDAVGAGE